MKQFAVVALAMLMSAALAGSAVAADEGAPATLEGTVVCAKCNLKEKGREECQNVLKVQKDGDTRLYYLANTEANQEFGHVCTAEKRVRATGSVSQKDGKDWLDATALTLLDSGG